MLGAHPWRRPVSSSSPLGQEGAASKMFELTAWYVPKSLSAHQDSRRRQNGPFTETSRWRVFRASTNFQGWIMLVLSEMLLLSTNFMVPRDLRYLTSPSELPSSLWTLNAGDGVKTSLNLVLGIGVGKSTNFGSYFKYLDMPCLCWVELLSDLFQFRFFIGSQPATSNNL